jgi:putative cell wall-binding protein
MRMQRHDRRRWLTTALAVVLPATLLGAGPVATAQTDEAVRIEVLSNRADLVSGGDALVEVAVPTGVDPETVALDVDGRDITDAFAVRPNGRFQALVTGLALGENVLTARLPDGAGARLTITNHPIGGPVFSGPQIQPWTCSEGAQDEQCNRPPTYEFLYKSTNRTRRGLQPYDPDNPPSDVAQTTTTEGETVPFVVREETGVLARDQYRIAVLYNPEEPWEPWAPQRGYNRKVVVTHGASCDTHYQMASAPSVGNETALGAGFAVMSHALDNSGHNCHIVTQAESLVMTKELLAETYGPMRYTIGSGCSGGALAQQWIANAYPGVYQGITPACSFTDAFSSGMQKEDYLLLRKYFEAPSRWAPGVVWGPRQLQNVYGHPNVSNPITFTEVIPTNADPSRDCVGVPEEDVYNAETNPEGVRCSIQDFMINVFGERTEGDNKAGRAADNVGIQYGLSGLEQGILSPAQFVDVNAKVGSHDIDYEFQLQRRAAEQPALQRVYTSGAANVANNMDEVAIIDLRGPDPGAFHDVYLTYALRERLIREHGHADNQILWRGQVALFGDVNYVDQAILAMDRWLAAVEADTRDVPLAQKIVEDRPDSVDHRCTDGAGRDLPASVCDATVESYSTPRFEAGMPLTDDTIKCELKPLRREDYPVEFTDAQWAQLEQVFPDGVCDYTKPGAAKQGTIPWLTYAHLVGGEPMGDPPVSVPFGPDPAASPAQVVRHAGPGRVETATAVSGRGVEAADTVVLARADDPADALAGGPLAVAEDAPLLLTASSGLSAVTRNEIRRLGASEAILLGGPAALGEQVVADLERLGVRVRRVAGTNRFATAAEVAALLGRGHEVFVALGDRDFADALSASAIAASAGSPILLVAADRVPAETAAALDAGTDVTVVGGTAAISTQLANALDARGGTLRRLSGDTRYATSAAVARAALARGATAATTWIASGHHFPDALVSGAAAARDGGLLLLVDGTDLDGSPATRDLIAEHAGAVETLRVAGGAAAVSDTVEDALADLIGART